MKVIILKSDQSEALLELQNITTQDKLFKLYNDDYELVVSFADEKSFPSIVLKSKPHEVEINRNITAEQVMKIESAKGTISVTSNLNSVKEVITALMSNEVQKGYSSVGAGLEQFTKALKFNDKAKSMKPLQKSATNSIQDKLRKSAGYQITPSQFTKSFAPFAERILKAGIEDKTYETQLLSFLKSIDQEQNEAIKLKKSNDFIKLLESKGIK